MTYTRTGSNKFDVLYSPRRYPRDPVGLLPGQADFSEHAGAPRIYLDKEPTNAKTNRMPRALSPLAKAAGGTVSPRRVGGAESGGEESGAEGRRSTRPASATQRQLACCGTFGELFGPFWPKYGFLARAVILLSKTNRSRSTANSKMGKNRILEPKRYPNCSTRSGRREDRCFPRTCM